LKKISGTHLKILLAAAFGFPDLVKPKKTRPHRGRASKSPSSHDLRRIHLDFSCQVEANGGFSAIKLTARISGPGHIRP
jgi:hypothetical protein